MGCLPHLTMAQTSGTAQACALLKQQARRYFPRISFMRRYFPRTSFTNSSIKSIAFAMSSGAVA
jgi:hypothetical protein